MNFGHFFPMFFRPSSRAPTRSGGVAGGKPDCCTTCVSSIHLPTRVELIRFALYGRMNWISLGGRRRACTAGLHDRRESSAYEPFFARHERARGPPPGGEGP